MRPDPSVWTPWASAVRVGLARADISPPLGLPTRNWAASTTLGNTGRHRPLTATAVAMSDGAGRDALLISLDLGWWRRAEDEARLRRRVLDATGLAEDAVLVHLVHTHAGPYTMAEDPAEPSRPVADYLDALAESVAGIAVAALERAEPATITWSSGHCGLAVNRDLPRERREVVAFNPRRPADDTLLVGRVTGAADEVLAVLVNYACHPTTLAWENSLVSPDWVGSAREVVEEATGARCVVLQGASGDLSPRDQATADPATADRNGRVVGYAALGVLENMPAPGRELVFKGVVESGAPLGIWEPEPARPDATLRTGRRTVGMRVAESARPRESADGVEVPAQVVAERRLRHSTLAADYVADGVARHPLWVWRVGAAVVVAHPGEAFSDLQLALRQRHPGLPIVVMNCTNGPGFVYLPPAADYAKDKYQVWQTLVGPGGLELLIEAADRAIGELVDEPTEERADERADERAEVPADEDPHVTSA